MITQKPISVRINTDLLERLDQECFVDAKKRNWVINNAIATYLYLADLRRSIQVMKEYATAGRHLWKHYTALPVILRLFVAICTPEQE